VKSRWLLPALVLAFVIAIAGTFFFGYRIGRHAHRMRLESESVRGWMTVPFAAHTHHVPPDVLYKALGVEPREHDRRPIRALAHEKNRRVEDVLRDLDQAIANARRQEPGAPPGKEP
jgi:hypothetical protein